VPVNESRPPERPQDVTSSVAARVQSVLSTAQREATELQREVERSAERRATEILMDAEREAQRMLTEADDLARQHLEETRGRLDAYAADRIQRIHAATERLLAAAEGLAERFEEALEARRSLAELMTALGEAAEDAAAEVRGPLPPVPPPPRAPQPPEQS
jgi:cell division septum initiation protein DivIVA